MGPVSPGPNPATQREEVRAAPLIQIGWARQRKQSGFPLFHQGLYGTCMTRQEDTLQDLVTAFSPLLPWGRGCSFFMTGGSSLETQHRQDIKGACAGTHCVASSSTKVLKKFLAFPGPEPQQLMNNCPTGTRGPDHLLTRLRPLPSGWRAR